MKKVSPKHSACKGFSLAEALMALLVVSLITIATIPVITKKKRSLENIPHGQWTCEIDEDGMHSSYSQDAPTPVVNADHCEFTPPPRAKNFIIKAVGGGGGGGAGYSNLVMEALYPGQSKRIDFLANNQYDIVLVGGGGGGGGGNDERGGTRAHAGGSGAAVSFTFKPTYNISYSISVGGGGGGGHGDDGKHSGGDGGNGGDTNFGNIVFAGGGTGGMAIQYDGTGSACIARNLQATMFNKNCRGADWRNYSECVRNTGRGCSGKYSYSDPSGSLKITNVKSVNGQDGERTSAGMKTSYYSSVISEKMLMASNSYPYSTIGNTSYNLARMKENNMGMSGGGGQGKNGGGTAGVGGYAAVKSDILSGGKAGQAARLMLYPAASINERLIIKLGKGGSGGKNIFTSSTRSMTQPTDGTDTVVGNLFRAPGGEAGKNQAIEPDIASASYVAGEDGAVSGISANEVVSYGGRSVDGETAESSNAPGTTAAGGGGGGGGAKRSTAYGTSSYNHTYSGDGADGGNGKVIIKW